METRSNLTLHCLAGLVAATACTMSSADPGGVQSLASVSSEIDATPRLHGSPLVAGRSAVELDSRQPVAGPWRDVTSMNMRYVQWGRATTRGSVGVSMGVAATQVVQNPAQPLAASEQIGVAPEVGVRWRSAWAGDRRMDVGAYGSYDATPGTPAGERRGYGARVELQFRDRHGPLGFDAPRGALGMHLNANSQVMLRSRHGGPMVYYRSQW